MPEGRLARTRAKYLEMDKDAFIARYIRPALEHAIDAEAQAVADPMRRIRRVDVLCPKCQRPGQMTPGYLWHCDGCKISWMPSASFKPSWQGRGEQIAAELQGCECKSLDTDLGCMHTERQPMR